MAAVEDPIFAGRMLRRADNLLTNNGKLVKELEGANKPLSRSSTERLPRRENSLGASIRRKFQEVKSDAARFLSRSRSLSGRSSPVDGRAATKSSPGHAHSLSEANAIRPPPPRHSISEPVLQEGIPAHRRALSNISEKSQVVVASPIVESSPTLPIPKAPGDIVVPQLLQLGTPMTKVSSQKRKKIVFRIDPDLGQIVWESKQHKIIPIENIKEIRSGNDARYYREQFQLSQEYEDRWLTIIYMLEGNYKTLHLIAATKDVFRMWDTTLRQLHVIRQELMRGLGNLEMRQALWEKQYWKGADEESDQKLTFEEVEKLCKRLNINSSQEDLYWLFKQADTKQRDYLDFEDFQRFVKLLKGRPEIHRLYNKLKSQHGGIFDFGVFEKFMRECQKSNLNKEELTAIFNKYTIPQPQPASASSPSPDSSASPSDLMSLDSFTSFLLSLDNSAFSDQHLKVHHDMTRPLPEYYISSSHNTYLVGHQLVGDSTIEGYIRALLHSCRSVEVDIYDGDVEPMIFHGKTFTSKVSLREVCKAIQKYGFIASPYPIIISAEVHCGLPQQSMIAEIMIEVFGDSLVKDSGEGRPKIEALPSPEDLKGKILLKTKNLLLSSSDPADSDGWQTDPSSASASESDFPEPVQDVPPEKRKDKRRQSVPVKDQFSKVSTNVLQRVRSIGKSTPHSPALQRVQPIVIPSPASPAPLKSPAPLSVRHDTEIGDRPKPPKMSLALVALLVYTVGVKCRGLNKKEEYAPEHMFSLSETAMNKILKFGMVDLIKHTRGHLIRIYPKGTRVSSTNYEPHRCWAAGAQLVAINWQTFDMGYMINHAMFQRNGRSGYVLKPLALRAPNKELLMKRTNHIFEVAIISAQQLPRPKNALGHEIVDRAAIDPFVEVSLYVPDWPAVAPGLSRTVSSAKPKKRESVVVKSPTSNGQALAENLGPLPSTAGTSSSIPGKTISFKTGAVKNNGFNPVWEEELQLKFECVGDMLDLVFVRFVVRRQVDKEGDEPLGVYCASLGSLERGYRHLPLHDSQLSQYLFSTLFVRINIIDL